MMKRPHWLYYPTRWWWVKDPRVAVMLGLSVFAFSRMFAYIPSLHPEPLTWGLQVVSAFLPLPVFAGMWGSSAVLMVFLAFSRSWFPPAMGFVSAPAALWGIAYLTSSLSEDATPRDLPTAFLYLAMSVVFIGSVLIPPQVGGWKRKITISLRKRNRRG